MNARTLIRPAFSYAGPTTADVSHEHGDRTAPAGDATTVWDRIDAAAERYRQATIASGAGTAGTPGFDPSVWEAVGRRVHSEAVWLMLAGAANAVTRSLRRALMGRRALGPDRR